jgi:tetratricopeptide (TPR) repeat protein
MHKGGNKTVLICIVLSLLTLALYWPVREHSFINYDDPDYVAANPIVQNGLTGEGIKWAFTTTHSFNWHPLTWISHMLDFQLFGMNPGAHHLVNVALHLANSLLLFWVLMRVTGAPWRSGFVAAMFAWHPLHVESVAWACERKDVLSTLFWMLATLFYVRYAQAKQNSKSRAPARDYWLAIGSFALGLTAKPMLVTLPFVFLLMDVWPLRRFGDSTKSKAKEIPVAVFRRLILEKLPFFALTAISCVVTFLVQRREGAVVKLDHFPVMDRILNAIVSYARYLGKTVWPADLVIFYEPPQRWGFLIVTVSLLLIVLISALVVWQIKKRPYLFVGWCWFLGSLVPVIGIVQVGMQSIADRYMYVPMIGLLIAISWGMADLSLRFSIFKNALVIAAPLSLAACLGLTASQLKHWKDSETLFQHVLKVNSNNVLARVMLGNACISVGKFDEGTFHFRQALERQPNFPEVHFNLGNALMAQKQINEAIAEYQIAMQQKPDYTDARGNFAVALGMQGRLDEAVQQYQLALQTAPNEPDLLRNLAIDLTTLRRFDEAQSHLQRVIAVNPNDPLAYFLLGDVGAAQGKWADAAASYAKALQAKPDYAEAQQKLAAAQQRAAAGQ